MDIFICRATPLNFTLIPYTEQDIIAAVRHFFPTAREHFFGADGAADHRYLLDMHEAVKSDRPMLSFDTNGKIPLHKAQFPIEQNKFSYYSDAPYSFLKYIEPMKAGANATYSDRSFKQFYDDVGFDFNPIFMPHGGPNEVQKGKLLKDRKYPISFVGYIKNPEPRGPFENLIWGSDDRLVSIVRRASEMNLHEGIEAYVAFRTCALEAGFDPLGIMPLDQLGELLTRMGHWAEAHRRLELLRAFKGYPLHIFGPVLEDVKGVTDQPHHFYGATKGAGVLEALKESRILLNSVTILPDGSHERIWFALAHGCMIYTDASRFVMESYKDGDNILFINYEDLDQDVQRIQSFANDADTLQPILERALPIYEKNHTWLQRIESTFRQMPEISPYMP